jgi:DNA repair ATPase RecN
VELRLSDLMSMRQKYTETVSDYLRQFREVRNRCYNLTIAEKDFADLAFAGLTPHLKDKLDG